jgi:hypothetical protein
LPSPKFGHRRSRAGDIQRQPGDWHAWPTRFRTSYRISLPFSRGASAALTGQRQPVIWPIRTTQRIIPDQCRAIYSFCIDAFFLNIDIVF